MYVKQCVVECHLCPLDDVLSEMCACLSLPHPRGIGRAQIRPILGIVVVRGAVWSSVVACTSSLVKRRLLGMGMS